MSTRDLKSRLEKLESQILERKAQKEKDEQLVKELLEQDPRAQYIPKAFRVYFAKNVHGEERERLLEFVERHKDDKFLRG